MLKVMIADDNPIICKALESRIPWQELELRLAGVCHDGSELLALAQEEVPDIILTDIQMPVTDGFSLVEGLMQRGIQAQVILISGYDDFRYMKKAIDIDVVSYIKKPVQDEELQDALRKAAGRVKERQAVLQISQSVQTLEEREHVRKMNARMLGWLRSPDPKRNVRQAEAGCGQTGYARWLLIQLPLGEDGKFSPGDVDRLLSCRELLRTDGCRDAHVFQPAETLLAAWLPGSSMHGQEPSAGAWLRQAGLTGRFVEGRTTTAPEAAEAFLHAVELLYESLYGAPFSYTGDKDAFSHADHQTLRMHLSLNDYAGASRFLSDWLERYFGSAPSCVGLDAFVRSVIGIYGEYVPPFRMLREELETAVLPALALPDRQALLDLLRKSHDWQESDGSRTAAIIGYIEQNFDKPISLEQMAKNYHYNVIYLGQLIKRETGLPFNQLVSKLRIDRAVDMLERNRDIKLSDLSQQLGFSDSKYFSKVFKKLTGRSPSQF